MCTVKYGLFFGFFGTNVTMAGTGEVRAAFETSFEGTG